MLSNLYLDIATKHLEFATFGRFFEILCLPKYCNFAKFAPLFGLQMKRLQICSFATCLYFR